MTPLPPVLPLRLAKAATSLAWWLVVLGLAPEPAAAAVNLEAAALLTIRKGFTNGLEALPGWTDSRSSPCTWEGIGCDPDTGQVVEVDLAGLELQGTIKTEGWMQLERLQRFSLASNRLTGTLASDWLLPDTLQEFNVSTNRLGGTLPPDFRFPSSLKYLYLLNNTFTGTIPAWELPEAVTELSLFNNRLSGPYPRDWVLPPGLLFLDLGYNQLTGTLDPAWVFPPTLQTLSLSYNRFRGTIPSNWTLPDSLQLLYLHTNPLLTGTIPQDWVLPAALANFALGNCNFSGPLPTRLKLPSGLQTLFYNNNSLTGTIPADWELPDSLQALDVSNNSLTGTIPSNWALPESLQTLVFFSNSLTGTLPTDWPLPASLQTLVLFSNSLTGPIPANLTLPSGLLTLKLSLNQLTGSISKDWKLPSTLQTLYLNDNQLTGTLDPAWELPESLLDFQIAYNNLSGLLPAWNLPNLKLADFRYCNFTGPLPAYPAQPTTTVAVMPQSGDGFCGEVPSSPPYYKNKPSLLTFTQRLGNSSLDSCPPDTPPPYTYPPAGSPPPQSPFPLPPTNPSPSPSPSPGNVTSGGGGGSSSTVGIAVGLAVGVVASVAAVLGVWWWIRRSRRRRRRHVGAPVSQESFPPKLSLEDDVESSPGQRCSPGKGGFEEAAEELSFSATDPANSGFRACTASTSSEAAQGDPVLAVALKTGVSDGSVAESAALQQGMSRQTLEMLALRMWIIDFDTLELQRQIGEGSFGRVYLATWQHTPVAVKILLNTALDVYSEEAVKQALTLSSPVLENLQKEAALMCSLRHPSIVTFLGVCPVPPCVVTEYCARGSLADVLRTARQSPAAAAKLDWLRRLNMMLDTAKGMLHLHSHSPAIIHRDLKSANLLVDTHWRCKVSDFNLSRILEDRVVLSSAMATNPRWLAPEVLEGHPATLQSDVYSFGVVLWEVLTWDVPFANDNHFQLIKHVAAGGRPPIPPRQELPGREGGEAGGLDDYVALMRRCWAQAPEERPSFQYVVGIFKDILTRATSGRRSAAKAPGEADKLDALLDEHIPGSPGPGTGCST